MGGVEVIAGLAEEYWNLVLDRSPLAATFYGDHRADDALDDLSASAEDAYVARLVDLRARTEAAGLNVELPMSAAVTRAMLLAEVDKALTLHPFRLAELACDQMQGPHADLLMVWPQLSYGEPGQAQAALDRLGQVPRFLEQAVERFREGLARRRSPAAIVVRRSLSQLEGYLAGPLDSDPFLQCRLPAEGTPGWHGEHVWREEAMPVLAERVRPAFLRYRDVLREEILPRARSDEQPGMCWTDGGADAYDAMVLAHTSLELDPREVHERGRREITEVLAPQFAQLGERVLGSSDLAVVFDRLRNDPELRHRDADEIVRATEAVVARAAGSLTGWFGRTPQAPCVVAPVPDFLAADAPPAYYFPPAPDGSRPGTYFTNTFDATSRPRFELESVAFHEAIPGHHLQLALANEMTDLPEFQKHVGATAYVEGWGLYAERLADEMGLYSDDLQRLGMLSADAWRAGRLVVDTGLHALGWSRQRAIDYLTENTPVPVDTIAVEVDRYIAWPGQALAYKVGQHEILRLRERAREHLSRTTGGFDIAAFHDVVLGFGAVTLPVLEELVGDWAGWSVR
jgi:uncharacterized protein (DUF885 family)